MRAWLIPMCVPVLLVGCSDDGRGAAEPTRSSSLGATTETTPTSRAVKAVEAIFDPPVGVPGAVVTLTARGLDDYAGREVDLGISTPSGDASQGAGSGRVDDEGHLVVDVFIPNVIEHEHEVTPGRYTVSIQAKPIRDELRFELQLDVEAAQIGVPYRHQPGYTCADYMWFDQRLWVEVAENRVDWSDGAPEGTFELVDSGSAVFATDTDSVDLRVASPEERAVFDPMMFQCPT